MMGGQVRGEGVGQTATPPSTPHGHMHSNTCTPLLLNRANSYKADVVEAHATVYIELE